jgi:3'-phosphoadenosine 5'-phosphosulfate sulfotransferase (PAPS reductase)/FAD synthetase
LEAYQLRQRQSLPLEAKIVLSQQRIKSWYDYWRGEVYISFSEGKDSTVLLDFMIWDTQEQVVCFVCLGHI